MIDSLYFALLKTNLFDIYYDEITFLNEDEQSSIRGNITFQTSPYPEILITGHDPENLTLNREIFPNGYDVQTLKNHLIKRNGSEVSYEDEHSNIIHDFTIYLESITTTEAAVDEVVIFIMNCGNIASTYIDETEYQFEHNDWIINFKFRPDRNKEVHYEHLRKSRGFEITHVGTIFKKNKECFRSNEIESLIPNLEWYLSFCSAQNVFIPIQIGYKNKSRVWEKYVIKNNDLAHFQDSHGWVPRGAIEDFNNFFTKVATKLGDELWKGVFEIVLNWYLEIKGNGMMENKIISTQVALEQLAWTYLVNQEQMLDKEAYKKLRAADILRLLCYQLKISKEVDINYFSDDRTNYNDDGVFMFVDFRNNLVHHEKKTNIYHSNRDAKFIVYSQGVYFLEKAIIEICGYEGQYKKPLEF